MLKELLRKERGREKKLNKLIVLDFLSADNILRADNYY